MLLTAAMYVSAQQPDTTFLGTPVVAEEEPDPEDMFNALDYSLQKRYRAKDDPFYSEKFSDNTFFFLQGGAESFAARMNSTFSWGGTARAGYGKWFNPYNALKATLAFDHSLRNRDRADIWRYGLDVSHMFNLSSYFWGYRDTRFLEVSTVEGLRYRYSVLDGEGRHSAGLHLGFNFKMNLSPRLDVFIEPLVTFYTDGIDHSGDWNWHRYDIAYGVSAGMSYKINSAIPHKRALRKRTEGNMFVSLYAGPQFQNSDLVMETMGPLKSMGMHYAVAFGKWFSPYLAFRASLFMSDDKWVEFADGSQMEGSYYGGRIEVMFDLLPLFNGGEKSALSLSVLAGPEAGRLGKEDLEKDLGKFYFGVTGGVQFKCRLFKYMSVFLEPRFSVAPYTEVTDSLDPLKNTGVNYFDSVYNLNIGLEANF